MRKYFVILIFFFFSCSTRGDYIGERTLWYNKNSRIGLLVKEYENNIAFGGKDADGFLFLIQNNGDTILSKYKGPFPDWNFYDSLVVMYNHNDIQEKERKGIIKGYAHGWFKVKNGEFVDLADTIRKYYFTKDYIYNGMILNDTGDRLNLIDPLFDYGDIIGVDAKYLDENFCIYKLEGKTLKCISKRYNYKLKKDGIYFIPFPGNIKHKVVTVNELKEDIINNQIEYRPHYK